MIAEARIELSRETEVRILSRIVDAMLTVQTDLASASGEQWSHILLDSCREQKRSSSHRRLAASSC